MNLPLTVALPGVGSLARANWSDILAAIRQADRNCDTVRISTAADIIHGDSSYYLPTVPLAYALAEASPTSEMGYIGTESAGRDCEDFCTVAKAFLVLNGFGNLAIGQANFTAYDDAGVALGSHAALIGVTPDGVGWWEPQNDSIHVFGDNWMYPGADHLTITALIF